MYNTRKIVIQLVQFCRLPEVSERDIVKLQRLDGTPLQYILSQNIPMTETPIGNVQIGSFLSYQVNTNVYMYIVQPELFVPWENVCEVHVQI